MVAYTPLNFLKKCSILWFLGLAPFLSNCHQPTHNQKDTINDNLNNTISDDQVEEEVVIEDFNFRQEKIAFILQGYFMKYNKREFMALQDYFSSNVEQFIHLKNIPAKRVSDEARDYFSDKRNVHFSTGLGNDLEGAQVEIKGNRCTLTFNTQINWHIQSNPRDTLWEEMNTTTEIADMKSYTANVSTVFVFDEQYKIRHYQELKINREKLKTHQDIQTYTESKKPLSIIPKDTWIEKGEFSAITRTVSGWGVFGMSLVQIYHQNQSYWIDFDDFDKMETEEQI